MGIIFLSHYNIFHNKIEIEVERQGRKIEEKLTQARNIYHKHLDKDIILVVNFLGLHGLLYRGDLTDYLQLSFKDKKNLQVYFSSSIELYNIAKMSNYNILNIDKICFIQWQNNNFYDATSFWYRILKNSKNYKK